jgi:hypothetical protein
MDRDPAPIVFVFGCPRSGTSYFAGLVRKTADLTEKIREGDNLHPYKMENGLYYLQRLFRRREVVFARTKRDLYGIFKSFRGIQKLVREGRDELKPLADNSDRQIFQYYKKEHDNFQSQRHNLKNVIEIDYSDPDVTGLEDYCPGITELFESSWKSKPFRPGRLSEGIKDQLEPDLIKKIDKALEDWEWPEK